VNNPAAVAKGATQTKDEQKKSFKKRLLLSAGGIMAAAVTASLTAWLTGLPSQVTGALSSGSSPVLVSVQHLPGQSDGCGDWIVNKSPQDLTPMPSNPDLSTQENWIYNNDAADTKSTWLEVTVQGQSSRPVVLTDLQFIVVHRNYGPIPGALVGNACGGPIIGRFIEVDLSKQPVRIIASYKDQMPSPNEPAWDLKPVIFPYTVSATDAEEFMIIADANQCDCEWYAELSWSANGKNGESIINDQGRPFRTAPYTRVRNTYSFDWKSGKWSKDTGQCEFLSNYKCTNA
jgi:hypothetical protein